MGKAIGDLRLIADHSAVADYLVTQATDEDARIVGWIYRTENDEFDARRPSMLPIGVYGSLEQAAQAIENAQTAEDMQP